MKHSILHGMQTAFTPYDMHILGLSQNLVLKTTSINVENRS